MGSLFRPRAVYDENWKERYQNSPKVLYSYSKGVNVSFLPWKAISEKERRASGWADAL